MQISLNEIILLLVIKKVCDFFKPHKTCHLEGDAWRQALTPVWEGAPARTERSLLSPSDSKHVSISRVRVPPNPWVQNNHLFLPQVLRGILSHFPRTTAMPTLLRLMRPEQATGKS